jgi:hypothetical protein
MLYMERPPKPKGFDDQVKSCRDAVKKSIDGGAKPDFPEEWKKYKGLFSKAQHGKCGYCECGVIGPGRGDVEHFYPKGEVWKLPDDPGSWGREAPDLANVEARKHETLSPAGYWWLAYDWDNYLLVCPVCNQSWKISFVPVKNDPRTLPPEQGVNEDPLLLNPFTGPDPVEHLSFGPLGEIKARENSAHGRETIKICGLDRPSLTTRRREKAQKAHFLVRRIWNAQSDEALDEAMADLYEMGNVEYDFAGMVRAIFEQECLISWKELDAWSKTWKARAKRQSS